MHKTHVLAHLFFHLPFSHSAVSLASPSGLLCFHGNQGLKARYVSACTTADKTRRADPAVIPHSSFYFPLGQRLQSSHYHIHTPPPPHSSDRLQTQNAQSNLNKTLYTSPISSHPAFRFLPEAIIGVHYLRFQFLSC